MIALTWLLGCVANTPSTEPTEPVDVHATADFSNAETCTSCHEATVAEWQQSMHARAHASADPLYAGMLELRVKKQGEQIATRCAKCHNPMAPMEPDSPAGRAGVTCGACHSAEVLVSPALSDGRTVCLTCHEASANPAGVDTCTTGPENELQGAMPCVACHMPPEGSRYRHTFAGPHRAWLQDDDALLRSAVNVRLTREDDVVIVEATNLTGHGFPSGFPGRVASIRLSSGTWSVSPPELLFRKVYTDASGNPTLPPFATELNLDSRLKPGESRRVEVPVPKEVSEVEAELVFALLPKPAADALGVASLPEAQPVTVELAR